jgi:hypothetical protein
MIFKIAEIPALLQYNIDKSHPSSIYDISPISAFLFGLLFFHHPHGASCLDLHNDEADNLHNDSLKLFGQGRLKL